MVSLRWLSFITLIVATAALRDVEFEYEGANVTVGHREEGDFLVAKKIFYRDPNPKKRTIAFRPFDVPDEYEITQVRVLDQSNGEGGTATYEYGGPGMTRILLGFSSAINQGIHYVVELYGKIYKP